MTPGDPDQLAREAVPLRGRSALVTGASRRDGIGYAVARRLAAYGASVFVHHHRPHDAVQPWGADDLEAVLDGVRGQLHPGARLAHRRGDLADPDAPRTLVEMATAEFAHLDILVCNHARNGADGALGELDAATLDGHWAVDTRSAILLAQEFAAQHDGRDGGRVVFVTSGQGQAPMPGEVSYAATKGALAAVTLTIADQLADAGLTVNSVNPGPVQTGYLTGEVQRRIAPCLPFGRAGVPDDAARVISWLCTAEAGWITGQVLHSEGGFARWRS